MPLTEAQPDALAQTYARSLFELAQGDDGQDQIEACCDELETILELARSDAMFNEFLASRVLPRRRRARSLDAIFAGRISGLTLRFLLVLNEKGRLGHLPAIVAAFDTLVQERYGRVEVDVYTASPMSGEEVRLIQERLRQVLGREPIVHPYTDASMIGGVKFQIGDQLVDASLATRLAAMRGQLSSEGLARLRASVHRVIENGEAQSP